MMRWLKFYTVGFIDGAVHLGLLAFLVRVCAMHYQIATALAVEAAVLHNFVWHRKWTWADRPARGARATAGRLVRFNVANGGLSVLGNLVLMRLLAGALGMDPVLASLPSIAICAIANFLVSDRWIFEPRRHSSNCAAQEITPGVALRE